ncbi:MAG: Ubiquinone/menaquinone biosynthesis C-methylase UbiE [Candidatus Methanocomedens sp.]|nr:MAG: Ubiquinone/menaquinone biosynthesis C-methylase UbiE [ANME-2 cluster archaeon]
MNKIKNGSYFLKKSLKQYYYKPSLGFYRAVELSILNKYVCFERPVLDIGCGDGTFISLLTKDKISLGLDISRTAILKSKQTNVYNESICASATNLPIKDESFNTVFSNCAIEHIQNIQEVLFEINRVLKNGGQLIFTVPSENFDQFLFFYQFFRKIGFNRLAETYAATLDKRIHQIHKISPKKWEKKLNNSNMVLEKAYYYHPSKAMKLWDVLNIQPLRILSLIRFLPKFFIKKIVNIEFYIVSKLIDEATWNICTEGGGLLIIAKK